MIMKTYFEILTLFEKSYTLYCENELYVRLHNTCGTEVFPKLFS